MNVAQNSILRHESGIVRFWLFLFTFEGLGGRVQVRGDFWNPLSTYLAKVFPVERFRPISIRQNFSRGVEFSFV